MDDLESALSSVWGYSNCIFCLPRGCPEQYSVLSHILHYSGEGALPTVFCTANMKKANSVIQWARERSKNKRDIHLVSAWVHCSSVLTIYYGKYGYGCRNRRSTALTHQGSAVVAGLLKEPSPTPALSYGQAFSLFFTCASCAPFLKEKEFEHFHLET